jgi:hypothetical protein
MSSRSAAIDGFCQDFYQPVSGSGFVRLWVPAEHQGYCLRVGVAHGADDGETSSAGGVYRSEGSASKFSAAIWLSAFRRFATTPSPSLTIDAVPPSGGGLFSSCCSDFVTKLPFRFRDRHGIWFRYICRRVIISRGDFVCRALRLGYLTPRISSLKPG